jgi:NAD(P)-dependent dehydrogenase (short-subunit alcohol dehydrogenase family)
MNVKDRVAWITGGASGIGAATAKRLVEHGCKVMITDINVPLGEEVAEKLGENCLFVKADNTIFEELEAASKVLIDKWGRLDISVNSAGRGDINDFHVTEPPTVKQREIYEYIIKLNLIGSYDVGRISAYHMSKNEPNENGERGVIIFISSMAGDKIWWLFREGMGTEQHTMGYGSSKAGVLGLTRDMAVAGSTLGIRVNCIQPGYIKTPLTDFPEAKMVWPPMQLFPKDGGEPDNIASTIQHVVENYYINRANIRIDAGVVG